MPIAILSVYDKAGIVDFANGLVTMGWTLIASDGTARLLREHHIPTTNVADYTGSPEILSGRVKTLHPAIYGGLLARTTDDDKNDLRTIGFDFIDLVAVNLYPFEQIIARENTNYEDAIENIDIGGVTLIRAASKNHERVTLVCDPADYMSVLNDLQTNGVSAERRKQLALKGFSITQQYDSVIVSYLSGEKIFTINAYPVQELRYGENPHQVATLYAYQPGSSPLGGKVLQGKDLSYNNLLDLDAAWRTVTSFDKPTICIVKHLSPCGIASSSKLVDAFNSALESDPISAFGGIVASNRPIDNITAESLKDLFIECIISPAFTTEAKIILADKKSCRLIEIPDKDIEPDFELRSITRGFLKQSIDTGDPPGKEWRIVSKRQPTENELIDLSFAWKSCQFVKSNAIVLARNEATVGIGGGQPNRVDCVHIAIQHAGERSKCAVMASDAFFPFPDSIEVAAKSGITAVIQPGGSIRDDQSIAAADSLKMAMVMTGTRHFRH